MELNCLQTMPVQEKEQTKGECNLSEVKSLSYENLNATSRQYSNDSAAASTTKDKSKKFEQLLAI